MMNDIYHGLWRSVAKLPADWFPMDPNRYHVLGADDALKFGVVDRIATPPG